MSPALGYPASEPTSAESPGSALGTWGLVFPTSVVMGSCLLPQDSEAPSGGHLWRLNFSTPSPSLGGDAGPGPIAHTPHAGDHWAQGIHVLKEKILK